MTGRVIDSWVNVNMTELGQPDWLRTVAALLVLDPSVEPQPANDIATNARIMQHPIQSPTSAIA